jgi:hypothetical protein
MPRSLAEWVGQIPTDQISAREKCFKAIHPARQAQSTGTEEIAAG